MVSLLFKHFFPNHLFYGSEVASRGAYVDKLQISILLFISISALPDFSYFVVRRSPIEITLRILSPDGRWSNTRCFRIRLRNIGREAEWIAMLLLYFAVD